MKKTRKKVNYFKIMLAIITIPELYIIFTTTRQDLDNNLNLWRIYILLYMFVIFNIMYIFTKQKRIIKKGGKKLWK